MYERKGIDQGDSLFLRTGKKTEWKVVKVMVRIIWKES